MADEQIPQATPQPAPAPLSFLEKFNAPLEILLSQYKVFFIIFGVVILIIKFHSILIDLIVSSSKKTVDNATKQDNSLKIEENRANDQANQLKEEAKDLGQNKPKVDENWNK